MKIFSVHAKRTDFLRHHIECLRHFCKDDFQYCCIDNFLDENKRDFIKSECKDLGVEYIRFDTYQITESAWDHAPSLNSIKNISKDNEINVILEFDIFLINKFSFIDYIQDYDIAGMYQQRNEFQKEYLAPFIVVSNKDTQFSELNFSGEDGCDVGGNTRFFIPNKRVKWMKHTRALNEENDSKYFNVPYDSSYGCQILESSFIHYYRGTNWDGRSPDYEHQKTEWFFDILKKSKESDVLNHKELSKIETQYSHAFRYWNGTDEKFNSKLNPCLN